MTTIRILNWELGAHTAFANRICDTLWTAVNYAMYATQFFMGSPQSFKRKRITEEDLEECAKILKKYPTHVFTHFPYVANLAGSKNSLAWEDDKEQTRKTAFMLSELEYELNIIGRLCELQKDRKGGVVVHPGNHKNKKLALKAISKSINHITFFPGSMLVLENSAGAGTSVPTTLDEIVEILQGVEEKKRKHVGVCIDTCHLFACGEYDLSQIKEIDRFFTEFDEKIGMEKFTLLHLNDSKCEKGSRKDRHACMGEGYIWEGRMNVLKYLLDKCKEHNIPMVLETHGIDMLVISEL